jgi:hypothetical protein
MSQESLSKQQGIRATHGQGQNVLIKGVAARAAPFLLAVSEAAMS